MNDDTTFHHPLHLISALIALAVTLALLAAGIIP